MGKEDPIAVPGTGTGMVRIRTSDVRSLDASTISAWSALERNAVQPNANLSPYYVLPSLKYLEPQERAQVVLIERWNCGFRSLVGIGVFRKRALRRYLPLPHIDAFSSCHSSGSGLLIDNDYRDAALGAFFGYLRRLQPSWLQGGLNFGGLNSHGLLFQAMQEIAAEHGFQWFQYDAVPRSILIPAQAGDEYLKVGLANRRRDSRRRWKKLGAEGEARWRIRWSDSPGFGAAVEHLMRLEDLGWKGDAGTSLRARAGHADWFREVSFGFGGENRVFVTEITVDDRVISSAFYLTSGHAGFAFKIGWDPTFAKMAPGLLNELELIRQAPTELSNLKYVDSGAAPGSYIDEFWNWRHQYVSGVFSRAPLSRSLLELWQRLRVLKSEARRFSPQRLRGQSTP